MLALFNGIPRKLTYCKKLFFCNKLDFTRVCPFGKYNLLILRFNATANSFRGSSTCESSRKLSRKLPTSPTSQANIDWVDWQENLHWLTKNHCCTMLHYWKQDFPMFQVECRARKDTFAIRPAKQFAELCKTVMDCELWFETLLRVSMVLVSLCS